MQALFADPATVAALRDLHAQVAVAIVDFSPERAQVVRFLNQQQIPVIAWMMLPTEEGPYFNADNAAEAPARNSPLSKSGPRRTACAGRQSGWTSSRTSLSLAALKNHRWRLITTLLRHSLDGKRMRARAAGLLRADPPDSIAGLSGSNLCHALSARRAQRALHVS